MRARGIIVLIKYDYYLVNFFVAFGTDLSNELTNLSETSRKRKAADIVFVYKASDFESKCSIGDSPLVGFH